MRMYVGGEWTDGARQEELRSPYSGEVIDTVPVGTLEDAERALASAVRGAAHQRRTTGHEREAILRRAGDLADARVEGLAATISHESGKAITEARGEAGRAGDLLRLSAFEGTQVYGDSLPLDASAGAGLHRLGFTLRQPCGVVGPSHPSTIRSCWSCTRSRPRLPPATPSCSSRPARRR